jgi:hypothetical protein
MVRGERGRRRGMIEGKKEKRVMREGKSERDTKE